MRFPLATQLKTRSGDLTKDARMKNALAEIKGDQSVARKRPGFADLGLVGTGVAQLLTCWNGLLSVINDTLSKVTLSPTSVTVIGSFSPTTSGLDMTTASTSAAQSEQQLLIKSSDQAWIYTLE